MPTISVIIPAYNAERTILETIQSVQEQTYADFELLVINDGSTDRTLSIVQTLADSRIKLFTLKNSGVCSARNFGITHAQGNFISFLDADDLWTPDKLELQLNALKKDPEADVVYSWTYFFYEQAGEKIPGHPTFFQGYIYPDLLKENFISSGSNILIRKEAVNRIQGFDSTFPHCADWDFYLRLANQNKFVFVPKHQILYRQSTSSMTSTKLDDVERQLLTMLEKTYQFVPEKHRNLRNYSLAWVYQYCTQQYLQYSIGLKGAKTASQKFLRAVQLRPGILLESYGQNLARWLIKRWFLLSGWHK